MKLNSSHIEFVFDCMKENTTKIRNIKQYLKAVLFNAPNTIDSYYTARSRHGDRQNLKEDYHMAQKTGALIFDEQTDRYDIRFDIADYYGGAARRI